MYICPEIGYDKTGSGVILFKSFYTYQKKIPTHTKQNKQPHTLVMLYHRNRSAFYDKHNKKHRSLLFYSCLASHSRSAYKLHSGLEKEMIEIQQQQK